MKKRTQCSVCLSPRRETVEAALRRGKSAAAVGNTYGLSRSACERHKALHMGEPGAPSVAPQVFDGPREDGEDEDEVERTCGAVALGQLAEALGVLLLARFLGAEPDLVGRVIDGHDEPPAPMLARLVKELGFDRGAWESVPSDPEDGDLAYDRDSWGEGDYDAMVARMLAAIEAPRSQAKAGRRAG